MFCRKSQNPTARTHSLSRCPCCDPHLPRTESCKQATRAHVCHKNAIGLLMLGEVHRESGKGRLLSRILQINVVQSIDLFLFPIRAVCWQATMYCGTPRGSSNGRCFHGWINAQFRLFFYAFVREIHCIVFYQNISASLFTFFNLIFRYVSQ